MIYRHKDGTYVASSMDAEFSRDLSIAEGNKILRGECDRETYDHIIDNNIEGFMPSRLVECLGNGQRNRS